MDTDSILWSNLSFSPCFLPVTELQWLGHLRYRETMSETDVVRANECYHSARSEGKVG